MAYDDQNVFAKILREELPCTKVHETEHALAFQDIAPQAAVHVLVIPKGAYVSWDDFSANASAEEQADYVAAIGATARALGVDHVDRPVEIDARLELDERAVVGQRHDLAVDAHADRVTHRRVDPRIRLDLLQA